MRDARLDGHDADILALQGAGPFATAAELSASETSLQSAIDALNAALAALTTGGGTNLANAQAWPGQTTWDLLVGTNTIRNWHFQAPLSASLANPEPRLRRLQPGRGRRPAGAPGQRVLGHGADGRRDCCRSGRHRHRTYVPWTGLQAPILNEIGIALASYYTSSEVDGLIALANAERQPRERQLHPEPRLRRLQPGRGRRPAGAPGQRVLGHGADGRRDCCRRGRHRPQRLRALDRAAGAHPQRDRHRPRELLHELGGGRADRAGQRPVLVGQAVRNLHLTGPLVATLQNSGNTLQLDCQAYDQSETYTQAEVNTQISNAVNLSQYATQADIDSSLSAELASYWDQGQTSAEIASQISGAGFLTEAQGDARFHPVNGNAGGNGIIPMVLDNFTPRMIRALLPQAPLGANLILGNSATVQLTCDCYSKSESDGRYFSDYAPLDARYHVVNGNAGGGGIIPMVYWTTSRHA